MHSVNNGTRIYLGSNAKDHHHHQLNKYIYYHCYSGYSGSVVLNSVR